MRTVAHTCSRWCCERNVGMIKWCQKNVWGVWETKGCVRNPEGLRGVQIRPRVSLCWITTVSCNCCPSLCNTHFFLHSSLFLGNPEDGSGKLTGVITSVPIITTSHAARMEPSPASPREPQLSLYLWSWLSSEMWSRVAHCISVSQVFVHGETQTRTTLHTLTHELTPTICAWTVSIASRVPQYCQLPYRSLAIFPELFWNFRGISKCVFVIFQDFSRKS
jgi:hypothetical protein